MWPVASSSRAFDKKLARLTRNREVRPSACDPSKPGLAATNGKSVRSYSSNLVYWFAAVAMVLARRDYCRGTAGRARGGGDRVRVHAQLGGDGFAAGVVRNVQCVAAFRHSTKRINDAAKDIALSRPQKGHLIGATRVLEPSRLSSFAVSHNNAFV